MIALRTAQLWKNYPFSSCYFFFFLFVCFVVVVFCFCFLFVCIFVQTSVPSARPGMVVWGPRKRALTSLCSLQIKSLSLWQHYKLVTILSKHTFDVHENIACTVYDSFFFFAIIYCTYPGDGEVTSAIIRIIRIFKNLLSTSILSFPEGCEGGGSRGVPYKDSTGMCGAKAPPPSSPLPPPFFGLGLS